MDVMLASLLVFSLSIGLLISGFIDRIAAIFLGIMLMILLGILSPVEAFSYIEWNVLGILFGMWVITQYMVEAKIPDYIVYIISRKTRNYNDFVIVMFLAAGFVSIFVDNVLVILLFGAVMIRAAYAWKKNPILPVILIGLAANFMGTALLLGDLPPQLLHAIAGAEFLDFIFMQGKPSSFPILSLSFIIITLVIWRVLGRNDSVGNVKIIDKPLINTPLSFITIFYFIVTIILMSIRPLLGVPLGFITISTAGALAITTEVMKAFKKLESPEFGLIIDKLEWKAIIFYAGLFVLVGGLDASGFIDLLAHKIITLLTGSIIQGFTLLYWISVLISSIIEHDAYLLTMFYVVKDASSIHFFNPWPFYWALAWGGTLGSNATIAGAPALYVTLLLLEREGIKVRTSDFLKITISFTVLTSIITYIIGFLVWGH